MANVTGWKQGLIHPNGGWEWDFWTINSITLDQWIFKIETNQTMVNPPNHYCCSEPMIDFSHYESHEPQRDWLVQEPGSWIHNLRLSPSKNLVGHIFLPSTLRLTRRPLKRDRSPLNSERRFTSSKTSFFSGFCCYTSRGGVKDPSVLRSVILSIGFQWLTSVGDGIIF